MTYFIGICGGTGSGKSTLATSLHSEIGPQSSSVICLDSYYVDLEGMTPDDKAAFNYDHPDSIDTELLALDLDTLAAGKEIASPVYDFTTHSRTSSVAITEPKEFIIVEGILLFAFESIRQRMDYTVFVDCSDQTRFERRLSRDIAERNRTPESVERQWAATVMPMHNLFVEPYKHKADHIVMENSNTFEQSSRVLSQIETKRTHASSLI